MKSAARIQLPGSRGWKTSARSNQQPGVLAHLAAVLVSDEIADRGSLHRNAASLPSKSELCSKQYLDEDDKHQERHDGARVKPAGTDTDYRDETAKETQVGLGNPEEKSAKWTRRAS